MGRIVCARKNEYLKSVENRLIRRQALVQKLNKQKRDAHGGLPLTVSQREKTFIPKLREILLLSNFDRRLFSSVCEIPRGNHRTCDRCRQALDGGEKES
jgi:hypothetical protein